jgi:hypothetical protein
LDAHTIEHGSDKKSAGPDLRLSYHDNDHYNSVRLSSGSKPPPPIKTYIAPQFSPMQEGESANQNEGNQIALEEATSATTTSAASSDTLPDVVLSDKPPSHPVTKNSPCPCGSGLRYKKCCAAKEKRASRLNRLRGQGTGSSVSNIERDEPTMDGKFRVLRI